MQLENEAAAHETHGVGLSLIYLSGQVSFRCNVPPMHDNTKQFR
jgi:hypothetical protein